MNIFSCHSVQIFSVFLSNHRTDIKRKADVNRILKLTENCDLLKEKGVIGKIYTGLMYL